VRAVVIRTAIILALALCCGSGGRRPAAPARPGIAVRPQSRTSESNCAYGNAFYLSPSPTANGP
jgi:hypothetical protein